MTEPDPRIDESPVRVTCQCPHCEAWHNGLSGRWEESFVVCETCDGHGEIPLIGGYEE